MDDKKLTVLIVDDTPENIDLLKNILADSYKLKAALNGTQALKILEKDPNINMILLDIMMPDMDGYEVCRRIKNNPGLEHIPIIFISALSEFSDEEKGLELGAVDYITKPINPAITKRRIKTHLALANQNLELKHQVDIKTKELQDSRLSIIRQLGRAAEFKDNETGLHVIRMSHYTHLIAKSMFGDDNEWVETIFLASPMHDIGKIGIADHILLKQGALDSNEFDEIKKHPEYGSEIIGSHDSKLLQMAKEISLYHHEKWDGTGYPFALKGEDIPISARIVSVADVFDALTSERPYKKAWDTQEAINFIISQGSKHFDPTVVEHFEKVIPEILKIKKQFEEN